MWIEYIYNYINNKEEELRDIMNKKREMNNKKKFLINYNIKREKINLK